MQRLERRRHRRERQFRGFQAFEPDSASVTRPAPPGPAPAIDFRAKIPVFAPQRRIEFGGAAGDARRRLRLAVDERRIGAEDPRLLGADRLPGVAKPMLVIEGDIGDQRDIGIDNVHRVEAAAEADFKHRAIEPRPGKDRQRR